MAGGKHLYHISLEYRRRQTFVIFLSSAWKEASRRWDGSLPRRNFELSTPREEVKDREVSAMKYTCFGQPLI
jgi:hypothetical protein